MNTVAVQSISEAFVLGSREGGAFMRKVTGQLYRVNLEARVCLRGRGGDGVYQTEADVILLVRGC